jgi:hypothetical protein
MSMGYGFSNETTTSNQGIGYRALLLFAFVVFLAFFTFLAFFFATAAFVVTLCGEATVP